jgi:hypothetical protein
MIEPGRPKGPLAIDDAAVLRSASICVLDRLPAHAALQFPALGELGDDVPRLPLDAPRIPEDTVAHGDPPPYRRREADSSARYVRD